MEKLKVQENRMITENWGSGEEQENWRLETGVKEGSRAEQENRRIRRS